METPGNSGLPALGPFYWSVAQVELTVLLHMPLAPEGSGRQPVKDYRSGHCPLQTDTEQWPRPCLPPAAAPTTGTGTPAESLGDTAGTWEQQACCELTGSTP